MKLIKELLSSKKFVVSLISFVGAVAIKFGAPEVTITELGVLLTPMVVYVFAQGHADSGKEANKVAIAENKKAISR